MPLISSPVARRPGQQNLEIRCRNYPLDTRHPELKISSLEPPPVPYDLEAPYLPPLTPAGASVVEM